MDQHPSHQPQTADLERKLGEMFPDHSSRDVARALLGRYGTETWHREVERVRLAVLKLAGSDLTAIGHQVEAANVDYRDVLSAAEYPEYQKLPPGVDPQSAEAQLAIAADRRQYLEWLGLKPT